MDDVDLVLVLTENWTMTPAEDLRGLVDLAVAAEAAGWATVMVSEHVVLGRGADARGLPANPRDYAYPGNQDPDMTWPDPFVLLGAIASATTSLRLAASAVIAPLRHPLHLATQVATLDRLSEGRLVVQPTVSWHEAEYDALGVPFHRRGAILDEQLAVLATVWRDQPASHHGEFFAFDDIHVQPQPWRASGPRLWFGGQRLHPAILRRLVDHGHGWNPLGTPSQDEIDQLETALEAAGRDPADIERVGGTRGRFPDADTPAPTGPLVDDVVERVRAGWRTVCVKPSQYLDDVEAFPAWAREVRERVVAGLGETA
ncbi:TIGR03619 family F420-dependent LLM class oxidoreductase [Salsipaludibacter albus]|uniref:TIGR03619 family F420-dependent LLM class oxidoreductase n=1 Tax=Salsipaludibacter albus TaxID=2849650 RepID=UPI001EE40EF5|nr:TIGR03619 family F420-dependent LLM class oxidoreductase [Salsipaludibacter albus]MBY5162975.1 TIGR03619 family F420-dependent LLM class oxidoreductase [Salsipaludibacter albus]